MKKTKTTTDALTVVKKDVSRVVAHAEQFIIDSKEALTLATEELSTVKTAQKRIKEEEDKQLKPALATVEAIRALWRPLKEQAAAAEVIYKNKMTKFIDEDAAKQREQEAKLKKQFEEGKIKKEGTLARKMSLLDAPVKSLSTESGASIKTRQIDEYHYDVNLIPREYLLPNEALIKAAVKSGKQIPGVTITKKTSIAAR